MENHIELKPVKELLGMNFFIPGYQRGYRWKTRQVQDLLEDLDEFIKKGANGFYCLQPLVVKKREINVDDIKQQLISKIDSASESKDLQKLHKIIDSSNQWEVVDGQQRLTTIFIILKYLQESIPYSITYETREGSKDFLEKLNSNNTDSSTYIDFSYISNNFKYVENWFDDKKNLKDEFKYILLNKTQFIWYESKEDPIEVFTRLNIGKISLTNSELVKALFLNSSNYNNDNINQNKIALQWDRIENDLQKDEFWCFFHQDGFDQPTRIDYILNIVRILHIKNKKSDFWHTKEDHGTDYYQTFRFYNELFKRQGFNGNTIDTIWKEIKRVFDLFVEWYNDLDFYHYIGYLAANFEHNNKKKYPIEDLVKIWFEQKQPKQLSNKESFKEYLIEKITETIKDVSNLDNQYEIKKDGKTAVSKTACYPLLLLFNIQTVINQNRQFKDDPKFNAADFQRFPFHLFKKQKWDIEHIAPNTENDLSTNEAKKEWLESAMFGISNQLQRKEAERLISQLKTEKEKSFEGEFSTLKQKIEGETLNESERNKVWNFCLLDQSTNRSYGNSIFASKRREILERDRGVKTEDGQERSLDKIVYIPPCTKNAFMKYYTSNANNLAEWTEKDALAYKQSIETILNEFIGNSTDK